MDAITYLRQFRLAGYAVFDFTAAFLGIFLLSPLLSGLARKTGLEIPKTNWLYLTLPIGTATHLMIGKVTPLTRDFIDIHGHYILKAAMIGLTLLGLRNIKRVNRRP